MKADGFHGYHPGGRQPCRIIDVVVPPSAGLSLAQVDAWLRDIFEIEKQYLPETPGENAAASEADRAEALVPRVLALYGELLRAAGVPIFDRGSVVEAKPSESQPPGTRVRIALPIIDREDSRIFIGVLRRAMRFIFEQCRRPPDRQAAEPLLEGLHKEVVQAIKRVLTFAESGRQSTFYSACQLAFDNDIPFRHMGLGVMRFGWGAKSRLTRGTSIESDSAIGASICGLKHQTATFLRAAGLPAPEHAFAFTVEDAVKAARQFGWPVVVKPTDSERSRGVTIDISNEAALAEAHREARQISKAVLVERQVPGFCHRITMGGGKLAAVVRRKPKGVHGDGKRTVRELATAANAALAKQLPWRRLAPFPLDDLARHCLSVDGMTFDSVPDEGQWARLRPITSADWGGETDILTDAIHPDNVELARTVGRLLGLTTLGLDLITTDIARPWHKTGAIVNEANYAPQFYAWGSEAAAPVMLPLLTGNGDGRIPVHLVTGKGDLLGAARSVRDRLSDEGQACHLTTAQHSEAPDGKMLPMTATTLFARTLALAMRGDVNALVIASELDEWTKAGLAVDRVESAHILAPDEDTAGHVHRAITSQTVAREIHRFGS